MFGALNSPNTVGHDNSLESTLILMMRTNVGQLTIYAKFK